MEGLNKCKLSCEMYTCLEPICFAASFIFDFALIPQTELVSSVENRGEVVFEKGGKILIP